MLTLLNNDMALAAISWDPGFRGFLTVVLATLILGGSVWLLLSTNSGWRLGFLLSLTGLAGWMMIMGAVWGMYGIGYQGRLASWKVEEVNYGDLAQANTTDARTVPPRSELPDADELRDIIDGDEALVTQFPDDPTRRAPQLGDLLSVDPALAEDPRVSDVVETDDGWHLLGAADKQTGEAVASATAYLTEDRALFEAASEFVVLDAWSKGGKEPRAADAGSLERAFFKVERVANWPLGHPTHRVVVRIQQVIPTETVPGQPPPTPTADAEQPVISVVMVRDLGSRRQPAVFLFFISAIVFAICCVTLHHRDKLVAQARAAAAGAS